MRYRYAYQSSGHPILTWKGGPPRQTRAADSVGLGSLSEPTLVMPRGGAPEPINFSTVPMGCACGTGGMHGFTDIVGNLPIGLKIAGAVGAYFLYKKLKKK